GKRAADFGNERRKKEWTSRLTEICGRRHDHALFRVPEGTEGVTFGQPRNQKGRAGDPIAAHAQFVAGPLPRSGWLGSRPGTEDTPGWPGPGAKASCTGRCALAKHGPAG